MRVGSYSIKVVIVVMFGMLSLLFGCKDWIHIKVVDSGIGAPKFYFKSRGDKSYSGVEITNFAVHRFPGRGEDIVWSIESSSGSAVLVKEISYGLAPEGFVEVYCPEKLFSDERYLSTTIRPGKQGVVDFYLK
jgi:hypothetical protein